MPGQWILLLVPLIVAACTASTQLEMQRAASNIMVASRVAQTCKSSIGNKDRYQVLARHMPLDSVFDTTLVQMTYGSFATHDDVVSLGFWLEDVRKCRDQISETAMSDFPTALAVLVTNWNKDDQTFVLLATRKLAWGKAVMAIRTNHAETLAELARQTLQASQQATAERQAELSRRIALLSALTNLAP